MISNGERWYLLGEILDSLVGAASDLESGEQPDRLKYDLRNARHFLDLLLEKVPDLDENGELFFYKEPEESTGPQCERCGRTTRVDFDILHCTSMDCLHHQYNPDWEKSEGE